VNGVRHFDSVVYHGLSKLHLPMKSSQDELRNTEAELRRSIAELQESLSWKITAPLRWVSRPLFRAMASKDPVAPEPAAPQPAPQPAPQEKKETHVTQTEPTIDNATVKAVCSAYDVPPAFADGALRMFLGDEYDRNFKDMQELRSRYTHLNMYFDYTFSTNARGRQLVQQLKDWGVPIAAADGPRKAYLDIGFAYGGSLSAFANLNYDVTGIEISEKFAKLGRMNLAAAGKQVNTHLGDFLLDDFLSGEQKFDLITCSDVIEHVMDPEKALRKICRLLKPGGMAYIAYPTKLSIPYVRSDGHAQLFGLTLLDYFRAREAYIQYTGWKEYEVSDYYEPEWYLNTIQAAGCRGELVYDDNVTADVPGEIAALYDSYAKWSREGALKLDPLMRREMSLEFAKYSARMFQEYSEHLARNAHREFVRKWLDQLTRILVRKP